MMMWLVMMMVSMSILFTFLKHPLSMTFILIIQTFMISLITGLAMSTFIMSYIIMIIMISGMLVLFVYMSSIASNEKFKMNLMLMLPFGFIMVWVGMNIEALENTTSNINNSSEMYMLIKMFNYPTNYMIMFMVFYLFFTMISVSNIINLSEGPLRMKTYE
uniref:NADH dehydrogenase subunit 6 n=1 Tax=Tessaromerus quadriarticulatus TaxID=3020145 RepID=UPI0024116274|nr:NADH dehydrogenase subunit 6 [Tessaromerus quadriarticulatus]WEM32418.1 NADH dehydrogenase subunit 6 [Tessaromerus quadriarticulatus]